MSKKNKIFYLLFFFIICVFIIVQNKIYPFNILKHNYLILKKSINYSKNERCLKKINRETRLSDKPDYSFFIAGHTYGSPGGKNLGMYPKFYNKLLNSEHAFDFGILSGDVTRKGDEKSWIFLDNQLKNLDYDIYIAPGNHDINPEINDIKNINFKKRFGDLYQSFKFKNDLFVILNSNENGWSIKNQQLNFLKKELINNYKSVDNIFIISHHVIYINENFNIKVNSYSGAEKNINFWDEVYPLFKKYNNNYFIIAGDVGAFDNGFELFCNKIDQYTFLASGMGGGKKDNYLIFEKIQKKITVYAEIF